MAVGRARSFLAMSALACFALGRPSWAGSTDAYGFGPRSSALAGAVSADVRDGSAVFYNPAGLALAERTELIAGFAHASYRLDLSGQEARLDSLSVLQASILARGDVLKVPFAFGLALALPNGHLSKMRSLRDGEPSWVLYQNLPELVDLGADVAFRPFERVAVGGGIGFLAATRGAFDVTGVVPLSDGKGSEYDAKLRHEVDADLTSVRFPVLGVVASPIERLSVAAAYRGEARLEQHIAGVLAGNVDALFFRIPVRYAFETDTVTAFLPRQVVLGAHYAFTSAFSANIDLAWQQWSRYPNPVSATSTSVDAQVPAGLPVNLPPSTAAAPSIDPGFGDRWVPSVAAEYAWPVRPCFELALRGGYRYERSPAPRRQPASAFVDGDRHVVAVGTGLAFRDLAAWLPPSVRFDLEAGLSEWPSTVVQAGAVGIAAGGSAWSTSASLTLGF
jgi:long-chain fatty acid transport protein